MVLKECLDVTLIELSEESMAAPPSRRSGNYTPSMWDDHYIQSLTTNFTEEHAVRIEKLKECARCMLKIDVLSEKEMVEQLELVDAVQQLGLAYHFEEEISVVMSNISNLLVKDGLVNNTLGMEQDDLYAKALLFRLLRECGFTASQGRLPGDDSTDVFFSSFKDGTGNFKANLSQDIRGLLSLYQASYYAMEGEDTLDEAREFTTKYLKEYLLKDKGADIQNELMKDVTYAIELPLHWRVERLHHRWFIERCERVIKMDPSLLELAKLDFNRVQSIHKRELMELSRWWTDLDLCGGKLSFVRSRLVENYFAAVGWGPFEPNSWRCREALAKVNFFITTLDDIYDVYGSLDELEVFTIAVERWEVSAIHQLPEYMKMCLLSLHNFVNDLGYKILRDKSVDIIPFLQRAWTNQCKAYLVEARWYHQGYVPTLEEYMANAQISVAMHIIITVAYCVNEDVTAEALEDFKSYPDITRWTSEIFRLFNDMETSTEEQKRGDVPKYIQLYMHEKGVSKALARQHTSDLISFNWKKLNGERFSTFRFEKAVERVALNLVRSAQCFYQDEDGYGKQEPDCKIKDHIISLLIKPILL